MQPDGPICLYWNAQGDVGVVGETAQTQDERAAWCPEEDELELWYEKYASELSPYGNRPAPEWDGSVQLGSGCSPERDRDARTERRAGGSGRYSSEDWGLALNATQRGC